ncbi:MAG: helix-turn-helix transcriptional regulator [Terriglobia bacterium]
MAVPQQMTPQTPISVGLACTSFFAILTPMDIGKRLREIREAKGLSQADIEKRSGLLRSYVSRVEGGYTAPSLATLEKFAKALEVEPHQLLLHERTPPKKFGPSIITTPPPSPSRIAKVFGLSKRRVDRISRLVESVQNGKP